uniref:Cytoplasmic dynein 2 light intermediate chain 1 n=1 Tax=Stegastes partitus TaxID=144197 RepID=A0A3B5AYK8_9TELE
MPKLSSDTLWELAAAEVHSRESGGGEEDGGETVSERSVFLMGSKAGGKTSILLRCLDRCPCGFVFQPKDIAHIWELGGGTSLSDLVQIPITPVSIRSLSVILILDLSKPNVLWGTMEKLLQAAQGQLEKVFSQSQQAEKSKPGAKHQTPAHSAARVLPKDYPDRELISPFPVPLLIIGSKYDMFQEFDSDKKKVVSKTLRFVAHYYAASLIVNNSPTNLGSPPSADVDITSLHAKNPKDLWKKVYERVFPQESTSEQKELKDPGKDPQYSEPQIDAMRAQKDQELEQYKRNAAKSWKGLELET